VQRNRQEGAGSPLRRIVARTEFVWWWWGMGPVRGATPTQLRYRPLA